MNVSFTSNTSGSAHFIPASLAFFVSIFISVLHLNLPEPIGSVSLLLLPLLMVALWPSGVNAVVTIVTFLLMGIFMDWGTNGALGQWAFIYLTVFTVLRPDRRENYVNFIGAVGLWVIGALIGVVMLIVTGWLVYGVLPNFPILFKQICLVSLLMPLVVITRNAIRYWLTDPHDRPF